MTQTQQPEALRLADKYEIEGFLQDHRFAQEQWCRQAAAELRRNYARINELEEQLSAIGAGGVEPLRKQAARRAPAAPVPQGWKPVPVEPTSEMLKAAWKHGIDDEAPDPYYAYKAMLAAVHPAEGVPAPLPVLHPHHCTARTADGSCEECEGYAQAMAEWNAERTALAATHPTQQGLELANCKGGKWLTVVYHDIQPGDESRTIGEHPKVSALSWSHALNDRDAALAAQAKGGAA